MPRKKKNTQAEQQDILNRPPDEGQQAVKALMSEEFLQVSNLDAAQIALMLSKIIQGQSVLQQQVDIILSRQDQIDQQVEERLKEQSKFIEEVYEKAEKLQQTGLARDKVIAQGMKMYADAKAEATARVVNDKLAFEDFLAHAETTTVVWPGKIQTTMKNGQQTAVIAPVEVHIKHKHWAYRPGSTVTVPKIVADRLEEMQRSEEETSKLQELLSSNPESSKLADEWNKIEGSSSSPMPR